jgi:hypothetical protein
MNFVLCRYEKLKLFYEETWEDRRVLEE